MSDATSKIDPRSLRVADVVRLLNTSPLWEVAQAHVVARHLNRAAFRIGDGKRIDLLKYAAWLFHDRAGDAAGAASAAASAGDSYASHRERMNARIRESSESVRDIAGAGWVHEAVDADRRERCHGSFRAFCDAYCARTFHLPWSEDHLKVIGKIQAAVIDGGLFAMAMPRGSGKTTLCEIACVWALLYGHREFVALIGADESHAGEMLESIKNEIESNDLLEEDFSEVCGPVRAMEGISQRASGQLYRGARTHIGWTADEIVLPTIEGSRASGGIIRVAGITGRIRGMKHKRSDGRTVRPSLVLLDDPQTDESARSPSQCITREQILSGAILGLAGPGAKIAGLMTLTVVRPDDMADRMLDREKHPAWQGERTRMMRSFPTNEEMWKRYASLRSDGLRNGTGTGDATAYYRANQAAFDAGAEAAWPARRNADEVSAIQHAMNLRLDQGDAAFFAEYQNQPLLTEAAGGEESVDSALLLARNTSGHDRGVVPEDAQHVTAFIDVQGTLLYYAVCAWADDFTGYVIDYGAYPDQGRAYFTLRDATRTLGVMHPGSEDAAIARGLSLLIQQIATGTYATASGERIVPGRILVDANWGEKTDLVYRVCQQHRAEQATPSRGRYYGATSTPMADQAAKPGDRNGPGWRMPALVPGRGVRHVAWDTNAWKSDVMQRLRMDPAERGAIALYDGTRSMHQAFADHLAAEYRVKVESKGRTCFEWKQRPGQDNHWWDCLVGCAVGASVLGVRAKGMPERKPRKRMSLRELQAMREEWRGREEGGWI